MLAIDVGAGTQDILVAKEPSENSFKMVLPSPTLLKAEEVSSRDGDLFVSGRTMGGGPVSRVLEERAERDRVVMTPESARTIRDDLEEVRSRGIEISKEGPEGASEVFLADFEPERLDSALSTLGIRMPGEVAIAVQDHGVAPPGLSDRENRVKRLEELMGNGGARLGDFVHSSEPEGFTRVASVIRSIKRWTSDYFVMDTKLAAVAGALPENLPALVVDAGNGHTMAALIDGDGKVASIAEHHTSLLEDGADDLLDRMIGGKLTHEEVFEDGGHGAYTSHSPEPESFVATGPRREILGGSRYPFEEVRPLGDVMMTGPYGLFRVAGGAL